jgi:hypothetical protein
MIELERLMALALDELSGDELDRVELHVLSCSSCARTLERLLQLGSATRRLLLAGKMRSFLLPGVSARLDALGLISRRYRLAPDQMLPCSVGSDDVYALTELEADLTGVTRLDVLFRSEGGGELRVSDVPFDAGSGLVSYIVRSDALRQLPTTLFHMELRAVEGERERVLGKYTLAHDAGRQ